MIAVLKGGDGATHTGGLPATWFTAGHAEYLRTLEHGDWADYPTQKELEDDLPAILVRGMGPVQISGHLTQKVTTAEMVRVVHVRPFLKCYTDAGGVELNMTRARQRYAKIINAALMHDPHKKLAVVDADGTRHEVALTTSDAGGARVPLVLWDGWDLGHDMGTTHATEDVSAIRDLGARVWAIACDLQVQIDTGGQ